MKRFACQDIIPGCSHIFTGADDQSVLDQVIVHAAEDHGLVKPPLALVELVVATTHTFTPARPRGHLRLVGAEPADPEPADPEPDGPVETATSPGTNLGTPPFVTGQRDRIAPAIPFPRREAAPGIAETVFEPQVVADTHSAPARRTAGYLHDGVFYRGLDGFLSAVVPFIRDGLALDEPVMVAVAEPRLTALRDALGADARRVIFADMAQLGGNPASIIPAARDFVAGSQGRPTRGVGEAIWAGRRSAEIAECQLHEALMNLAVPPETPLWLICPYDIEALDEDIIAAALLSHSDSPAAQPPGSASVSSLLLRVTNALIDPAVADQHRSRALSLFSGALPEPAASSVTALAPNGTDGDVAGRVFDAASAAGLPAQRSAKLAAAVDEVVTAGARDSGAEVSLRWWRDSTALVWEVGDRGIVTDPLVGRGPNMSTQSRDRGIRLANELCDLVQVRSNSSGTIVRMHSWL